MDFSQILSCALDLGEQMLISGAEVYRVEDCIRRICFAYGATDVDVFTITSSIVVTIQQPDGRRLTQTRRIERYATNLHRVHELNQLSRLMCREHIDYASFSTQFRSILAQKPYPQWSEFLCYAMVAAAFTMFFGGSVRDAGISAFIGVILKATVYAVNAVHFNHVLSNLIASFVLSVLAYFAVRCGWADTVDMIVIGNIMLIIPGVALTNSLRDMISGDTMAGILRFIEACILALAIAGGYILASVMMGGMVL